MPRRAALLVIFGVALAIAGCLSPAPASSLKESSVGSTLAASPTATSSATAAPRVVISTDALTLNTPFDPQAGLLHPADFPDKATLVATVYQPDGTYTGDVLWSSSNTQLVSVDASGDVWSVTPGVVGSVTVTAVARAHPSASASLPVTVVSNGKVQLDVQ